MGFFNATSFNSDISAWDIARVANMDSMFEAAHSFQQDLCLWSDKFNYAQAYGNPREIFTSSGCKYSANPQLDKPGPFCASTCQAATVVWSTLDDSQTANAPKPAATCEALPASPRPSSPRSVAIIHPTGELAST